MVAATSLEFLKNLAQYEYANRFFDFHNDFTCEKIFFSDKKLLILVKNHVSKARFSIEFEDAVITSAVFFNTKDVESLTIDTMYRGRAEVDGKLKEISEDGQGYFYLEFYEGQKLEFWAAHFDVLPCADDSIVSD
jgi:hypothetical protein